MSVLLPAHDGLARHVATELPDVEVVALDGATAAGLDRITFYCLPYMGAPTAVGLVGHMPSLRVVQSLSSGVDDVVDHVPGGVELCNGLGLHHEESTAELAVLLILAALRRLPELVRAQARGEWRHERGTSLVGRRVVLLGYGRIGKAVEARLLPFGAQVSKVARTAREGVASFADLVRIAGDCDVLVVCLPLTAETRGLVDADVLAALPDGALLVNVGRGPTVDAAALREEVVGGRLHAAVDVTDPEPLPPDAPEWSLPQVLLTPHVGGDTTTFVERARSFLVEQVRRHVSGEPLHNVVSR